MIDTIYHNESTSPCEVYRKLRHADFFLTTHGFQSMALIFMKKDAYMYELYNYKYWKEGYRPLALNYGLKHSWAQNSYASSISRLLLHYIDQDTCMKNYLCRRFSRTDNVHVDDQIFSDVASHILRAIYEKYENREG